MSDKKFIVFVIQYGQKNEEPIEKFVKKVTKQINAQHGEIRRVYQGSDASIVSALEKVLKLTE